MGFRTVRTYQFRNLQTAELSLDAPEIFLVGENGQGKSNFLEAIYLLCFGGSFRVRADRLLIRDGENEAAIAGTFSSAPDNQGWPAATSPTAATDTIDVQMKIARRGGSGTAKEIRVNDKIVQDRKELISNIPCILFGHDDISFVSGAPEGRRWFFNQTMSLHDPLFIDALRRYQRLLRLRNSVLKERRTDLIDVYGDELAAAGIAIQERRAETTAEFDEVFATLFRDISGLSLPLRLRYLPSWGDGAGVEHARAELERRKDDDMELGMTTSGPHRDRYTFTLGKRNFARYASTGQLRLVSLILRVAQAVYYQRKTLRKPVLLLDDVLLELDLTRRERFLAALPPAEQRFFTFLPDEQFRPFVQPETVVHRVHDGAILKT